MLGGIILVKYNSSMGDHDYVMNGSGESPCDPVARADVF
jgi:hypothetical protein